MAAQHRPAKARAQSSATVKGTFDKMTSAVFLDYKGMTVEQVTKLRAEFRKAGVEYKVVKNTLVKQALKDTAYGGKLERRLVGMTGIAWSYEDPSAAAKVVKAVQEGRRRSRREAQGQRRVSSRARFSTRSARREPARDDARQGRAPRHAARDASGAAPAVRRSAPGPAQNFVYVLAAKERQADRRLSAHARRLTPSPSSTNRARLNLKISKVSITYTEISNG